MQSQPKVNVLLVDDHPENIVALEAILSGLGQNLVSAFSGEQALKCLLEKEFAVILLDVQMSGMDGFEVATLIRQRPQSRYTPIIFLTAYSDSQALRSRGYALGAVDYLLKPIDPAVLTSKVAVFVELFKKNLEVQQQAAQLVAKNLEVLTAEAARRQAEEANRIKDEFLAIVSHELRTPLNSILGWSQLLLTKKFDEATTAQALQTIARNAKSQAKLVEDILDISRLVQHKLKLSIQPIDAIAVIKSVLESAYPSAEEKSIQLKTELDEAAKVIAADPERLRQIIWNLLTNAIKFTPPDGQITVKLSVAPKQSFLPHTAFAQLQVIDTGIGIAAEFLPHIFEHFRQADSSSTRSQGGLGLGLAIAAQLVTLHHGKIVANSEGEGKGTSFTVYLPLAPDGATSEPESEATKAEANDANREPSSLNEIRVLFVEDHYDSRASLKLLMEQAGATVTAVASTREAIARFNQTQFHILVSDIAMPEEDGYQLIRQIREQERQQGLGTLPAIALTAYAKPEDQALALVSGFQMHISKPVEPARLMNAIAQLTSQRCSSELIATETNLSLKNT